LAETEVFVKTTLTSSRKTNLIIIKLLDFNEGAKKYLPGQFIRIKQSSYKD
jgi:hypothetical protein